MMGTIATMLRKNAPMRVIFDRLLRMYSAVGAPGRHPRMVPPFFFRLFDTSIGLKEI